VLLNFQQAIFFLQMKHKVVSYEKQEVKTLRETLCSPPSLREPLCSPPSLREPLCSPPGFGELLCSPPGFGELLCSPPGFGELLCSPPGFGELLCSPPGFGVVRVVHRFSFLCCLLYCLFVVFCLRPNIASVFELYF
jgi:hypothetical protein